MKTYNIKTLLTKDRGATINTKGYYKYSSKRVAKMENTIVKSPYNMKQFDKFRDAVLNQKLMPVSSSFTYSYVGFVLDNNMVINLKSDDIFEMGSVISTPKGRIRFIKTPAGYRLFKDPTVDEDLESMTESIYELIEDDMVDTLLYGDIRIEKLDGRVEYPRIVVKLPNIKMKAAYADYFKFVPTRRKLLEKLENQMEGGLNAVLLLDEHLPAEYSESRRDWTPEERVYRYICDNPFYIQDTKKLIKDEQQEHR